MFKKIKEKIAQKKQAVAEKAKLEQMQKYYEIVRCGATFIKFVQDDLNKKMDTTMNRHDRRRMNKSLQKGEITKEIVVHYSKEADRILGLIDGRLNPVKQTKPIDGAKVYKNLCKKEKK